MAIYKDGVEHNVYHEGVQTVGYVEGVQHFGAGGLGQELLTDPHMQQGGQWPRTGNISYNSTRDALYYLQNSSGDGARGLLTQDLLSGKTYQVSVEIGVDVDYGVFDATIMTAELNGQTAVSLKFVSGTFDGQVTLTGDVVGAYGMLLRSRTSNASWFVDSASVKEVL